jgi:carbon storage regulator
MLVLMRSVGEAIVIGDDVRATVVAVGGNKVRVGITAPSNVHVCRGELLDRGTTQSSRRGLDSFAEDRGRTGVRERLSSWARAGAGKPDGICAQRRESARPAVWRTR